MGELDVIIGGGEVGNTLYQIIKRVNPVAVVDFDKSKQFLPETKEDLDLFRKKQDIRLLHICVPFVDTKKCTYDPEDQTKFIDMVSKYIDEYKPKVVVIHSTVSRGTTVKIAEKTSIPVIYSATRGVHTRFMEDMEYYTKFWATISTDKKTISIFRQAMSDAGFKLKQMSKPDTLELAKLLTDTTYYGVLISYAQQTKVICDKYGVDYDEMWQFAEEGHAKVGNRPKMYPGYIAGHCLDGDEILFIKTDIGMKPITIREYVDNNYTNEVLSYDKVTNKPIFDKVVAKWSRNFSGNMVTLTSRTNRSITTTDEHIMLTSDNLNEELAKNITLDSSIPFVAELPNFDIKKVYNFENENWRLKYNMPNKINITADFCRLLGYYVAEGSISNYGKGYSLRFSFNKNELKYIKDVCKILKSIGFNYYTTTQNNVTHIGVKSTPLSLFIVDTLGCGRSSNTKSLPEFIYFAPRDFKNQFISGYFRGDGSFMPELGLVSAGSASKTLISGLDILLLSLGYVMTFSQSIHSPSIIDGRTIKGGLLYALSTKKEIQYNNISKVSGFEKSVIERTHAKTLWHTINNNLFMIKTSKIKHTESEQQVYSIDTKNHLFVSTGGRVIHNCVIPNLFLLDHEILDKFRYIDEHNKFYKKWLEDNDTN